MAFPYLQVAVAFRILSTAFDLYVTHRQHKRYHPSSPPHPRLVPLIPHDKFVAAQKYCRAKSSFQILVTLFESSLHILCLLVYLGPRIWRFCGTYFPHNELAQTLLFVLLNVLLGLVLDLPPSVYSTFVLEARFGFNRTTVRTFVADLVKSTVLQLVLGLPILTAIYYVLRYLSRFSGVGVACGLWLTLSAVIVGMVLVYPSVIAPLFNRFDPLPEGALKEKLVALASRLGFPLDKMYVIDGSRRSSHSNAYVFGVWKKYICIYDSLLEQTHGEDEQVLSVLCHELGHWKRGHTVLGMFLSLSQVLLICALYAGTAGNEAVFRSFGYAGTPLVVGLMLLNELAAPVYELLQPAGNVVSRRFEYEADAFAREQGMAEELGKALVGMSVANLSNMSPDKLYSTWNYSHPTLLERLDALNVSPGVDVAEKKEN